MTKKQSFYNFFDKLSIIALAVYTSECVLGSSGRWLTFGSLSIRILWFVICFFITLPNVFLRLRQLARKPSIIFTVLFGVYLLSAAIIGWRNENALHFIKADLSSYMALALLPGFLATICTKERIKLLLNVVFYSALTLGIVTTILHFYLAFASESAINTINQWLNEHHMGGFSQLELGIHRIYMRSQIFLQVGLMICLQKIWTNHGYRRWLFLVAAAVISYACLMTFTRGFWIGLVISAVLLLCFVPSQWKQYFYTVGNVAVLIFGLFLLSWVSYGAPLAIKSVAARFDSSLLASMPDPEMPTDPSDGIPIEPPDMDADQTAVWLREQSLLMLSQKIKAHPILGNGLGTNLDGIRDDGRVEYMYHDVLMKLGAVGFLMFCTVFFLPVIPLFKDCIQQLKSKKRTSWSSTYMQNTILLVSFAGVAVTSSLNPFLINPMGILLVMLLTASAEHTQE